jgi:hypothetical protein
MSAAVEEKVISSVVGLVVSKGSNLSTSTIIELIPKIILSVEKFSKETGDQKKASAIAVLDKLAASFCKDPDELSKIQSFIADFVPKIIDEVVKVCNSKEFQIFKSKSLSFCK